MQSSRSFLEVLNFQHPEFILLPMPVSTNFAKPLRGIIPPMVTPLLDDDTLDLAGLERLIDHLVAGGIHGIFILGTTGEGPSLSHRLQRQMIRATVGKVAQRVPVLVGITDTSVVESIRLAQFAADVGAFAVVSSAPHYFRIAQPELYAYFHQLVKKLPLPLVLYNMPNLTKVNFEPDTITRMLSWDNVIGIKDSSGDMEYATRLIRLISQRPDWTLMTGPEELLADSLRAGVMGGVCGGANLFPRLYVDLYEADRRNDLQRVRSLHEDVLQISQLLYSIGRHDSAVIKGIKCALSCLKICNDHMAPPLGGFQKAERRIVRQRLERIGQLHAEGIRAVMADYSNCH